MSKTVDELVKRLRAMLPQSVGPAAADFLEALAGEVERLGNLAANYEHEMKMAVAERDRLKEALLDIKHFGAGFAQDRARKALGGDAS